MRLPENYQMMRVARWVAPCLMMTLFTTRPASAQAEPELAARQFFHRLGRLQWEPMSDLLHPETLREFDQVAHQIVESLRGDSVLIQLYGVSQAEFQAWSDKETFVRTMAGMVRYARGLMESQVSTDMEILGTVAEGDSLSHVVYREVTDHMGTLTGGVAVVTLERSRGRWLVRQNAEIEVLKTALRGVPIGRSPPPGA